MEAYHFILLADAKKIALDDAGVSEKVTFTEETLVAGGIKTPYYRFVLPIRKHSGHTALMRCWALCWRSSRKRS